MCLFRSRLEVEGAEYCLSLDHEAYVLCSPLQTLYQVTLFRPSIR